MDLRGNMSRENLFSRLSWQAVASSYFSGWMLSAAALSLDGGAFFGLEGIANILVFIALLAATGTAFLLSGIFAKSETPCYYFLLICSLFYAFVLLWGGENFYRFIGAMAALGAVSVFLLRGDRLRLSHGKLSGRATAVLVSVSALLFCVYVGTLTALRYYSYMSPTYDFGIFSQMFYYMKTDGTPMTTCEREGLLSHFAVHMSPTLYILLPFYMLFPHPVTLIILQTVILASGVVPLCLIARRRGLSGKWIFLISALYLLYPAIAGGCFYDFHENKLLAPLVLWLLWALESDSRVLFWVFAVLTLGVKEDSAVYVAFIALFIIAGTKKRFSGIMLFLLSVMWFAGDCLLLDSFGEGIMSYRYNNFTDGGSLFSMVVNIFLEPGRVLTESFLLEKLYFIAYMLLPLGCLPLLSKKPSRFILLLPMLLVNLMPNYGYQYTIDFQYTYGVAALLFYTSVCNLSELSPRVRRAAGLIAVCAALCVGSMRVYKHSASLRAYNGGNAEYVQQFDRAVACVPDGASVSTTAFILPHLSQRREVYAAEKLRMTDYAVIDLRTEEWLSAYNYYIASGYETVYADDGLKYVAVLKYPG